MGCDQWLDNVLPWRKRKRALKDEEEIQAEEMALCHNEDLAINNNSSDQVYGFRYKGKDDRLSCEESRAGRWFQMLSTLMTSNVFDRGNQIQLMKFIYQGNAEGLGWYLDGFSLEKINQMEIAGQGLLHVLCFKGDIESLKIVLTLGCEVNRINVDGVTPLHLAVSEGWTEGVEELLSYGASANIFPVSGICTNWPFNELPLLTAARNGDFETAFHLLDQNPNLLLTDSERNSVLHLACFSHCVELVSRVLEDKIIVQDISRSNNKGNSPLHMLFVDKNSPDFEEEIHECVQLLLHKGARINHLNAERRTPLYLAARANLPLVVKTLLISGADPKIKGIDGKTVLHAACSSSSHESLSLLLNNGRISHLVQVEDKFGYSPFHVAINSCSANCCEILLQNGDHLTKLDSMGRSRCSLVLKNLPSALVLLKRLFDANIELSSNDADDPDFQIKMDFSVLLSKSTDNVEASLISDIGSSGMDTLFKHPLIETFLYLKWCKIRKYFYSYVFLYFLFLIVHTFYIVKTYGMNTDWKFEQGMLRMVHVTHAVMVILLMIRSTITIFANFKKYIRQWETYCKFVAITAAAFVVFAREASFRNPEVERNVAAISIFFTWVEFMMLLGRFPSLGVYILMFTRVAKSIIGFLLAFSPLLIAFTLAFTILLSSIDAFKSFPTGIVRTLMMMIGEIDYADIFENTKMDATPTLVISHIFLVLFLFLIPVLMANLLIGVAVNDLPDLQYHGKIRRLVKEASFIESYERLLLVSQQWSYLLTSILNMIYDKSIISREIYIYPNKLTHKMRDVDIPSEAIKGAIESGTIKKSGEDEVEIPFNKFYKEYISDQERLQNVLETVMVMVNSIARKDGIDVPDGKFTRRMMRSRIARK